MHVIKPCPLNHVTKKGPDHSHYKFTDFGDSRVMLSYTWYNDIVENVT